MASTEVATTHQLSPLPGPLCQPLTSNACVSSVSSGAEQGSAAPAPRPCRLGWRRSAWWLRPRAALGTCPHPAGGLQAYTGMAALVPREEGRCHPPAMRTALTLRRTGAPAAPGPGAWERPAVSVPPSPSGNPARACSQLCPSPHRDTASGRSAGRQRAESALGSGAPSPASGREQRACEACGPARRARLSPSEGASGTVRPVLRRQHGSQSGKFFEQEIQIFI